MATMTLIGMYNYRPDLFDFLDFPEDIDKNTVRDTILLKSANFELLYPDPDFVKDSIKVWSAKWYRTFDRWQKALAIDYEPLENYDRREEWTDTGNGTSTVTGTTNDSANVTTEQKVSAYNSDTMRDNVETTTESSSESSIDNTNTSETSNVRTGRAHGNIGVTTSQQMLEAELKIAKWNLYDHIADLFLSEYVIPVY